MMVMDKDLFRLIDYDSIESEKIVAPRYSYWRSVFRVFFKKKINTVLLALLVLILACAFIIPVFAPYYPNENVTHTEYFHKSPKEAVSAFGFSFKWIMGTGGLGNSIFYGIWSSARTTVLIAIICAAINMILGIILGSLWGYSKRFDRVMIVFYNIIANVPYLLLISVMVYVIGAGFWSFVIALTITGWVSVAYFFRTHVIIIRDREYSLASRCLGTPVRRIISKNLLPYLVSVVVTSLATELPYYISMELFLSYIGVGLSANVPSLGRMISEAQTAFLVRPWEFWWPLSVAILITVILYILGQNLADATDPRTHM